MSITLKDLREAADPANGFDGFGTLSQSQCRALVAEIDRLVREKQIEVLDWARGHVGRQPLRAVTIIEHKMDELRGKASPDDAAPALHETQQRALVLLQKYPDRWLAPAAYDLPWQSFEALHRRGLALKRPETHGQTVTYRLRASSEGAAT